MIIDPDKQFTVYYAVQTCDKKSYQGRARYCSDNRTEISKKCVTSFVQSVQHCSRALPMVRHCIMIVDDHSTNDLVQYLQHIAKAYSSDTIDIEVRSLPAELSGIAGSIEYCYTWMSDSSQQDSDFVYQIQDDYMFEPDTVLQMLNIWFQMFQETGTHAVITPYNFSYAWLTSYRNQSTPRAVIVGSWQYWIQIYDCSCSWLTSRHQFVKHWDLYFDFFNLINTVSQKENCLENVSLNFMFTKRGVLGLAPVNSLAQHMQTELEKDPHRDWRDRWNQIDIDIADT